LITPPPPRGMDTQTRDDLNEAYDDEKDKEVSRRILAVYYVLDKDMTHAQAADMVFTSASSVGNWVARYTEGGIDALRDLPRSGRPREVGREEMETIIDRESQPHARPEDVRQTVYDLTGVLYHISTVRRRMRERGLSHKRGHPVHVNRASDSAVRGWQWRTGASVPEMEAAGFTIVAQDEAIITHGAGAGQGLWSRRGERVLVPYTGSRRKVVAYASIASDGRRLCELHGRFDAATFVAHLKKIHKKFGRVAVFLDRAPQHRAREVGEFVQGCGGDVRLVYLPVGTPELNVVEELWHQLRRLLVGLHVPAFDDFRRVVGGLLRTMRHGLDALSYLQRRVKRDCAIPRR